MTGIPLLEKILKETNASDLNVNQRARLVKRNFPAVTLNRQMKLARKNTSECNKRENGKWRANGEESERIKLC